MTFLLKDVEGGTKLTLIHEGLVKEGSLAGHTRGWTLALIKMEEVVAKSEQVAAKINRVATKMGEVAAKLEGVSAKGV